MSQTCAVYYVDIHSNHRTTYTDVTSQNSAFQEVFTDHQLGEVRETRTKTGTRCCHFNKRLFWNKVFYTGFFAAIGAILPYVAVMCKQHGLSPEQIGLITGVKPVIGFVAAPVFASLADRYRIRKWILLASVASYFAFYVGLFQIPQAERIQTCPDQVDPHRDSGHGGVLDMHRRSADNSSHNLLLNSTQHLMFNSSQHLIDSFIVSDGIPTSAFLNQSNALDSGSLDALNATNGSAPEYQHKHLLTESIGWIYVPEKLMTVFWLLLLLILCGEVFQAPSTSLSDASTLQTLGPKQLGRYGFQRAWGAVGFGAGSFLAGALVSSSRRKEVLCGVELYFSDYRLLTYVFIGFLVIAFIAATQIKFKEGDDEEKLELTDADGKPQKIKPPSSEEGHKDPEQGHNAKAVLRVFLNVHYMSWLATSFFVGVCNGVIWGFLYWHLDNLGADQLLMGVSGIVVCVSEFIMFFLVGKVIKLIGHIGIMYVGLVGYAVRFCIYATISNPWWVLPAEVLQGITFSIVWVSMTAYTALAVPSASLATIQGILHGVYFGLGSGSGHLIGGLMIGYVGAVITFFTFAGASIFVLIIFAIAQKCSVKPLDAYGYKDLDEDADTVTGSRESPDTGTGGTGPSAPHHTATDGAPGPTDAGLSDTPSGDMQQY